MGWILEGKTVGGFYMGHYVRGVVTNSRVALGGRVKHTVALLKPLELFCTVRTDVIMEQNEIMVVEHN